MKLKFIRRVLRALAGGKVATDSDQHLQVRAGCGRDADSDRHLQGGLGRGAMWPLGNSIPANAGRKDCVANAGRKELDLTPRSEELGERVRPAEEVIDPYSPVPEKSKFERRMEAAKNHRRRKHKVRDKTGVTFVRPLTHLEALLDDMRELNGDRPGLVLRPVFATNLRPPSIRTMRILDNLLTTSRPRTASLLPLLAADIGRKPGALPNATTHVRRHSVGCEGNLS